MNEAIADTRDVAADLAWWDISGWRRSMGGAIAAALVIGVVGLWAIADAADWPLMSTLSDWLGAPGAPGGD